MCNRRKGDSLWVCKSFRFHLRRQLCCELASAHSPLFSQIRNCTWGCKSSSQNCFWPVSEILCSFGCMAPSSTLGQTATPCEPSWVSSPDWDKTTDFCSARDSSFCLPASRQALFRCVSAPTHPSRFLVSRHPFSLDFLFLWGKWISIVGSMQLCRVLQIRLENLSSPCVLHAHNCPSVGITVFYANFPFGNGLHMAQL